MFIITEAATRNMEHILQCFPPQLNSLEILRMGKKTKQKENQPTCIVTSPKPLSDPAQSCILLLTNIIMCFKNDRISTYSRDHLPSSLNDIFKKRNLKKIIITKNSQTSVLPELMELKWFFLFVLGYDCRRYWEIARVKCFINRWKIQVLTYLQLMHAWIKHFSQYLSFPAFLQLRVKVHL